MQDANCLARQIVGARNKKAELDKHIKKLERDLLDTQLVSALLTTIHNEGGETTDGPYTVEIPRTHIWDQSMVDEILEAIPPSDWSSCSLSALIFLIFDSPSLIECAACHGPASLGWLTA